MLAGFLAHGVGRQGRAYVLILWGSRAALYFMCGKGGANLLLLGFGRRLILCLNEELLLLVDKCQRIRYSFLSGYFS